MGKAQDDVVVGRLKTILHEYVEEICRVFVDRAKEYQKGEPEIAAELRDAQTRYRKQADDAIEMIQRGDFTTTDLRHVAGTLYLTNLVLRWTLEQQTTSYRDLLALNRETGEKVIQARIRIEQGEEEEGFADLLKLVEKNRNYFPLLMTMGFIYLRTKKNLNYAMRYFEKAATSSPPIEKDHYQSLALQFLAYCHEGLDRHKNALSELTRAESVNPEDTGVLYSLSRMYGLLGQEEKSLAYFEKALRKHPAFYALALVDPAFKSVRRPMEMRMKTINKTFRELGRRFEQLLDKLIILYNRFKLEDFEPSLGREMRHIRAQLDAVRSGCYTGYRTGIIRFFVGSFPEFLHQVRDVMRQRKRYEEKVLREKLQKSRKKFIFFGWLLSPPLAIGAVAGVWFVEKPLLTWLPIQIPYLEYGLPLLGALTVVLIYTSWLRDIRKRGYVKLEVLREMELGWVSMESIEKSLKNFWMNEVAPNVEVVPVWVKREKNI